MHLRNIILRIGQFTINKSLIVEVCNAMIMQHLQQNVRALLICRDRERGERLLYVAEPAGVSM